MRLCRLCKKLFPDDLTHCPDHSSVPSELQNVTLEPPPPELAKRFPQHEAIARGDTGTLYQLTAEAADSSRVLKVLHASLTHDATERARYRRELRRQQNLTHAQLPRVHDVGETDDRIWFTRDFIQGESLAVRLQAGEMFDLAAAYSIIIQLAAALDALHQLGLVHRDVKPGHVLLRAQRSPRESLQLIDATLAGPLAGNATWHGTPGYAAKELIEGSPATFRSDLYGFGCLSYELLAGAPPFRDGTRNAAATDSSSADPTLAMFATHRELEPPELPDHVPLAVRSLITSMLARDAHRRPFSAQQVRRALEPHVASANAAARSASLTSTNITQPRAAALRFSGPAAKPWAPAAFPDATVELDVEDLDEAIQVNDEPTGTGNVDDVDDSAPTMALSNQNTRAIMSSMLPTASKPPTAAAKSQAEAEGGPAGATKAESAPVGPTHAPTGTKFGLGPVRSQDIATALALAAELKSAPLSAASVGSPAEAGALEKPSTQEQPAASASPGAAASASPPGAARPSVRRKRYSAVAHPLMQSPRVLLVAAAGLLVLIVLLRLALGPSETSRSAALVVQVPEAETDMASIDELGKQARQELEQLSEEALIGGNIPRTLQPAAAQSRRSARAGQDDQVSLSDLPLTAAKGLGSQPAAADSKPQPTGVQSVAAVTPAPVPASPASEPAEPKNVPTVSAGSVRGGLAHATSNRQAAVSGSTTLSAVNVSNDPDADYKAKGRALFKTGKYTEAVEAYQRAVKRDNSDASAYAGLGGSLLAKGETRRAITAYQRAVHLQPDVSGFRAALGRAYLQKGDRPRARAAYSKALALDPNNQAAKTGIASIKAH